MGFVPLTGIRADDVRKIRLLAVGTELRIPRNRIPVTIRNRVCIAGRPFSCPIRLILLLR